MPGRVGSCLMLLPLPVDSSGKRERKEPLLKKYSCNNDLSKKSNGHPEKGSSGLGKVNSEE